MPNSLQPFRKILGFESVETESRNFSYLALSIPGRKNEQNETPVLVLERLYTQQMDMQMAERITRSRTKGGITQEHWPADIDVLSVRSMTGSFILLNPDVVQSRQSRSGFLSGLRNILAEDSGLPTSPGLVPFRRLSEASVKSMELVQFYKSNGAVFDDESGEIVDYDPVLLEYMEFSYYGYFTNLSIEHMTTAPNNYTVSFGFKVQRLEVNAV